MMTELIVAMIILAMIMVAFAISLDGFGRLNHYYFTKQRCVAAAQAVLDSIAATGKPINETNLKRLWPDVDIRIDENEGIGLWEGLRMVKVTAIGKSRDKKTEVRLSRYFTKADVVIINAEQTSAFKEQ
jgi:type II secretory pathway pseudopilin PulG